MFLCVRIYIYFKKRKKQYLVKNWIVIKNLFLCVYANKCLSLCLYAFKSKNPVTQLR